MAGYGGRFVFVQHTASASTAHHTGAWFLMRAKSCAHTHTAHGGA